MSGEAQRQEVRSSLTLKILSLLVVVSALVQHIRTQYRISLCIYSSFTTRSPRKQVSVRSSRAPICICIANDLVLLEPVVLRAHEQFVAREQPRAPIEYENAFARIEMRFAGEKVQLDAEALEPGMSCPFYSTRMSCSRSVFTARARVRPMLCAETVPKEVTVAVLKPDLVASGRVDQIIAKVQFVLRHTHTHTHTHTATTVQYSTI